MTERSSWEATGPYDLESSQSLGWAVDMHGPAGVVPADIGSLNFYNMDEMEALMEKEASSQHINPAAISAEPGAIPTPPWDQVDEPHVGQNKPGEVMRTTGLPVTPELSPPPGIGRRDSMVAPEDAAAKKQQEQRASNARRRKKPATESADADSQQASAKRMRKPRKGSKAALEADAQNGKNLDGEQRDKFLERNRLAAHKCRQKKKKQQQQLQEDAHRLSKLNKELNTELLTLKNDVIQLKQHLLQHVDCECHEIRKYLKQTAGQLSPSALGLYEEALTQISSVGGGVPQSQRHRLSFSVESDGPTSASLYDRRQSVISNVAGLGTSSASDASFLSVSPPPETAELPSAPTITAFPDLVSTQPALSTASSPRSTRYPSLVSESAIGGTLMPSTSAAEQCANPKQVLFDDSVFSNFLDSPAPLDGD